MHARTRVGVQCNAVPVISAVQPAGLRKLAVETVMICCVPKQALPGAEAAGAWDPAAAMQA